MACDECDFKNFSTSIFDPTVKVIFIALEIIIAAVAVLVNGSVIFAFCREPKLRRRNNFYIISLTCADFLVGLLAIPFGILSTFTDLPFCDVSTCVFRVSVYLSFCNISILSLVLISVKRYMILSVTIPQQQKISTQNATKEIFVCWLLGILFGSVPMFWHKGNIEDSCMINDVLHEEYTMIRFVVFIIAPMIVMIFIYIKIYGIIRLQSKNEKKLKLGMTLDKNRARMRREIKATIIIFLVVLLFIICWIPIHIVYTFPMFCKSCVVSKNIYALAIVCATSSSVFNPLLYSYHMKDIRNAMFNTRRNRSGSTFSQT